MLNFTITDSTDLEKSIQVLNDSFRYLSHQNRFMKKVFNSIFIGGIRSLEVKVGENSKKWHPHLHCIVVKDKYSKDFEFLRDSWNMAVKKCGGIESSLDGKYGSVFVSSIVDKKNPKNSNEYSVETGVLETLKYITKFDYSSYGDMLPELVRALKGVRSINTWGCLRNINLDVEEDMDKTYSEVYKVACSVCGSTDFIKFTSRSLLPNTKCFDYSDSVLEKQDKLLPGKVEIRDGLEVGKLYGGVMFTALHATLAGKQFEVYKHKNKYKTVVVQNVEHIKEEKVYIPNSGKAYVKGSNTQTFKDRVTMPEPKELIFSEEMLVHYFK